MSQNVSMGASGFHSSMVSGWCRTNRAWKWWEQKVGGEKCQEEVKFSRGRGKEKNINANILQQFIINKSQQHREVGLYVEQNHKRHPSFLILRGLPFCDLFLFSFNALRQSKWHFLKLNIWLYNLSHFHQIIHTFASNLTLGSSAKGFKDMKVRVICALSFKYFFWILWSQWFYWNIVHNVSVILLCFCSSAAETKQTVKSDSRIFWSQ